MSEPLRVHKSTAVVGDVEVTTSVIVPTPEHDKLRLIAPKSQAIGDFLEWSRATLCVPHHHAENCRSDSGWLMCGLHEGDYEEVRTPIRKLLANYFEIDEQKLEDEKLAMLEAIRR